MKDRTIILIGLLISGIVMLGGCRRRPLDYDYYSGTEIRVDIDWGAVIYRPEHVRLLLYPEKGGNPLSYYIDPSGDVITAPFGSYRVLLYNWRSNEDIQSIRFDKENEYEQIHAYTDFRAGSVFPGEVLIQPDSLACWSGGSSIFRVSKPDNDCEPGNGRPVLNTRPVSYVRKYEFFIPATGLQYVKSAEAAISGIARNKTLYDAKAGTTGHFMSVSMTAESEGIRFRFSAFGCVPNAKSILSIKFRLVDGSDYEVTYDLTRQICEGIAGDIGPPIVIPEVSGDGGGFRDPSIGDWDEVYDDITFSPYSQ